MEKQHRDKSSSFTSRIRHKGNDIFSPRIHSSSSPAIIQKPEIRESIMEEENEDDFLSSHDRDQVTQDIDRFTDALSAVDDKSTAPDVPDSVETFSKIIESRIAKYNSGEFGERFGKMTEEDTYFIEAVKRISKLTNAFGEFPKTSSLNRTSTVLQRAMVFMEEEFRALLEDSKRCSPVTKVTSLVTTKHTSFNFDRCVVREPEPNGDDDFPGYSPVLMTRMSKIAATMIFAGYETECCQVYSMARGHALFEQLKKVEFEKMNVEDVQKMQWDSLEGEVIRWIRIVKHCSGVLFPAERKLAESLFADYPTISRSLFCNLARGVIIQLLDFAEAVAMTKRSAPEKVFKFLDMYEALRDLVRAISEPNSDDGDHEHEMKSGLSAAADRIGEAVVNIFNDFENSIKNDVAKTPVPGGAIHPLTRYVMNYLEYACGEYKDTLEQIFNQHTRIGDNHLDDDNTLPFAKQVLTVMDLLDANLEAKAGLYKDPALRNIFLMNNGRYILQKAKGSKEIHQVMGDTWCRRKSTVVRAFHKTYQRDTWGKLLQTITHDGLLVNGKVNRQALKERFKNFNNMFEEIHKSQSNWVVSDEQLLSELRVSISAVVIPAYRSFVGRFRQHLDGGRNAEKYMKYQPEDIETMIEGLFDGNPTSMGRRKS